MVDALPEDTSSPGNEPGLGRELCPEGSKRERSTLFAQETDHGGVWLQPSEPVHYFTSGPLPCLGPLAARGPESLGSSPVRGHAKATEYQLAHSDADAQAGPWPVCGSIPVVSAEGYPEPSGACNYSLSHYTYGNVGTSRHLHGVRSGVAGAEGGWTNDWEVQRKVGEFRGFVIGSGMTVEHQLYPGLLRGRLWLKPVHVCSHSGQQVVLDMSREPPRFLLFDDIDDTLVFLGKDASEAAAMFNFPDLEHYKLVDDSTGEVLTRTVIDPALGKEIAKELNMEDPRASYHRQSQDGNWETLAARISYAINNYTYSGVLGPMKGTIASVIRRASLEQARLWTFEGPVFEETLRLSGLKPGTVWDVANKIQERLRQTLPVGGQ